jgi:ferrous iron transport protein A
MIKENEDVTIQKVGGKEGTRKFLESLGFVTGISISIISQINGNFIINVKGSRIAIGRDMANKIIVKSN